MENNIAEVLKLANLQMAAEAFLQPRGGYLPITGELLEPANLTSFRTMLREGNTHSSRFPISLASEFSLDWEVLDQKANAPSIAGGSGFSGTLFRAKRDAPERGIKSGELVIAFRSTEFRDDNIRDSKSTNELELKDLGWAFGQIAEMQEWYAKLTSSADGAPLIPANAKFSVSGYSLGGHLATAFNLLLAARGEESRIQKTFTFNGAGSGGLVEGANLSTVINRFVSLRDMARISIESLPWESDQGAAFARQASTLTWSALADSPWASFLAQVQGAAGQVGANAVRRDLNYLASAMKRVGQIFSEHIRVSNLEGNRFAGDVFPPVGEQASIGYQVAALLAAQATIPSSVPTAFPGFGGVNRLPLGPKFVPASQQLQNMIEVYGNDAGTGGWSFVTNSGLHYGSESRRIGIYIEDQPLLRGSIAAADVVRVRLLQSNADENDFGDTHSLVLVVDSLALGAALKALDPSMTFSKMDAIYKAAGNKRKEEATHTQGKAEGNTLEAVLDGLRKVFFGTQTVVPTSFDLTGGTWANVDQRNEFHNNLEVLKQLPAFKEAAGKIRVLPQIATALQARTSFIDFLALHALTPFRLELASVGVAGIVSAIKGANAELAQVWDSDNKLSDAQRASGMATYSDAWMQDRAAMLGWIAIGNTGNIDYDSTGRLVTPAALPSPIRFEDRTAGLSFTVGVRRYADAALNIRRFVFGSVQNDTLSGADASDRLYGAGGSTFSLESKATTIWKEELAPILTSISRAMAPILSRRSTPRMTG